MTNKDIEKRIASAFDNLSPETTFKDIAEKLPSATLERRQVTMTKRKNILKFAVPAIAACFLIVAGIFGGVYYNNNFAVDSIIGIDVNPSIEITVNKHDRVLEAEAINADGVAILDGMRLEKSDLKVAVNAIIGSMVQKGYVVDETSGILVTVENSDSKKASRVRKEVIEGIDNALAKDKIDAPIINQTVSKNESASAFAKEHGISLGKAVFIMNISAKEPSLVPAELAKMSIKELAAVVVDNKIDIRDIADYDADDSIWENIDESIDEINDEYYDKDEINAPKDRIPVDEAKSNALRHAGINSDDAVFTKAELDEDDGLFYYEIDFKVGNVEYEYDIAIDGGILSFDKEIED